MIIDIDVGRVRAAGEEDVRVLRPLRLREGSTGQGTGRGPFVGIAVDVETTGLDPKTGKVIELAVRRFRYDADGVITDIDRAYKWREDPGEPLDPEISALTGLADEDLAGREIDTDDATRLLRSASFVVAHNSGFDRTWVENRLPNAAGLPWVCSMRQIDWRSRGFDGRVLGYLLVQNGFYHCGHRASSDVDALIEMLRHRDAEGTAVQEDVFGARGHPRARPEQVLGGERGDEATARHAEPALGRSRRLRRRLHHFGYQTFEGAWAPTVELALATCLARSLYS